MRHDSDTGGEAAKRSAVVALVERRVARAEDFAKRTKQDPPPWPNHPDAFRQACARERALRQWLDSLGVVGVIGHCEVYEIGTLL